jgi:hypothetical protein
VKREEIEYWIRQVELLLGEPLPRRDPGNAQGGELKTPLCAKCGGRPDLGWCGKTGKVESYCRKCADEEYLASLTPEERALLRNI